MVREVPDRNARAAACSETAPALRADGACGRRYPASLGLPLRPVVVESGDLRVVMGDADGLRDSCSSFCCILCSIYIRTLRLAFSRD